MLDNFQKLYALLTWPEKRSFVILVAAILLEALLEMIAVAMIPLFITTLAYPDYIQTNPLLASVMKTFNWQDLPRENVVMAGSAALLAYFVGKAAYSVFATYWKARFAQNRTLKLSVRLFTAYLRAPYHFHLNHNTSELFRDVYEECGGLSSRVLLPLVELLSHATILFGITFCMVVIVPPEALAWLIGFLLVGVASTTVLQRRGRQLGLQAQHHRSAVVRAINEGFGGVKEIRLLRRAHYFTSRLAQALGQVLAIERIHQVLMRAIPSLIESLGIVGLLGITVVLIIKGIDAQELVATLSVFAVALTRMKGAMRGMMSSYAEMRHSSPALSLVYDRLSALEPLTDDSQQQRTAMSFERTIEVRDVSVRYESNRHQALQALNLSIEHGEAIGLVGATGSGKSSLLDVLMGILEPESGMVCVDGQNIATNLVGWHARLGYIPQNVFLIDASVRANIALGIDDAEINQEALEEAVAAAELSPMLERLPEGINTFVGEQGVRLSGGERQRIAIARALYTRPEVLLMDEATSALDNTTEAAVVEAVQALKGDRTIIMIAHRLSTVKYCDRIVFLKQGQIDAIGSYAELYAEHREFRQMAQA